MPCRRGKRFAGRESGLTYAAGRGQTNGRPRRAGRCDGSGGSRGRWTHGDLRHPALSRADRRMRRTARMRSGPEPTSPMRSRGLDRDRKPASASAQELPSRIGPAGHRPDRPWGSQRRDRDPETDVRSGLGADVRIGPTDLDTPDRTTCPHPTRPTRRGVSG